MKQILIKIVKVIKRIVLLILNIFWPTKSSKSKETINKISNSKNLKENSNFFKIEDNDNQADSSRELFKEYIHKNKFNKEMLEKEIYKFIEKKFKIKIQDLPTEKKKKLKDYTSKKLVINVQKQVIENKIEQKEELEKVLKEELKKDIGKKEFNFEELVENHNLYKLEENNVLKENKTSIVVSTLFKEMDPKQKEVFNNPLAEIKNLQDEHGEATELELIEELSETLDKLDFKSEQIEQTKQTNAEKIIQDKDEELLKEILPETKYNMITQSINEKDLIKVELSTKNEQGIEQKEEKINIEEKEKLTEQPKVIQIDMVKFEIENNKIMDDAKKEYQKEDFVDKEYEIIENILEERIAKIENLLLNPLTNTQILEITNELNKLKNMQEQVKFHKKNDLEKFRLSLEELIPIEEKELINKKLKEFVQDDELKKRELLFQNLENKSKQELEKIEQIMIKESLKKTLRRLEIPLFFSFPFIKNKYFRKFVGGLFIFRSFSFIKKLLFRDQNPFADIDLSSIQKGSDALNESISITEVNIATFEELKKSCLIKYPQLKDDIEFMNDLNKIEENLYKNYERLLKQDKVVKKYFNKSKDLIRKRKKRYL